MSRLHHAFSFLLLPLLPATGLAQLDELEGSFEYGYQRLDYQWHEYDENHTELVEESGLLNRDYLAMQARFSDRLRLQFDASITRGYVDYDGQTQGGQPHQSRTGYDAEAYRLSAQLPLVTTWALLLPTVSYQTNDWQRRVLSRNGVSSIELEYKWPKWSLGLALERDLYGGQLQLALLRDWSSQGDVTVDLTAAGLARTRLALGDGDGYTTTLRYVLPLNANLRLIPQIGYQLWQWDPSEQKLEDSVIRYTVQEPESREEQAWLGVAIQFYYQ